MSVSSSEATTGSQIGLTKSSILNLLDGDYVFYNFKAFHPKYSEMQRLFKHILSEVWSL